MTHAGSIDTQIGYSEWWNDGPQASPDTGKFLLTWETFSFLPTTQYESPCSFPLNKVSIGS